MSPIFSSLPGTQAHVILEMAAYAIGAQIYWALAKNQPRPPAKVDQLLLVACAIFGGFVGSKLLHIAEHLPTLLAQDSLELWLGGKSVLGGFLGGTLGVELGKRLVGWTTPTGDAWVIPLCVGLVIGRMGCQLSGAWDQTYGTPTNLPWGWDYGDHLSRHPTALYEIVLVLLAGRVATGRQFSRHAGAGFAVFMLAYCLIRFALEFLKPPFGLSIEGTLPVALYGPLSAIQVAALAGLLWFGTRLKHRLRKSK